MRAITVFERNIHFIIKYKKCSEIGAQGDKRYDGRTDKVTVYRPLTAYKEITAHQALSFLLQLKKATVLIVPDRLVFT